MGFLNTTRELASLYLQQKKHQLKTQGTPSTKVDSGGTHTSHSWNSQDHDREKLREVKHIRETGGIVAQLIHQKALMFYGTGIELQTTNDDLKEWINQEAFPHLDNLLIELGEDAIWFPYSLGEIVETKGGDFSHFECVEPWTVLPVENEYGEIVAWEQEIQSDYGTAGETYQPDELASFILNKTSGRDNTGISEVVRAESSIDQWYENRQAAQNAIDQSGFRRLIATVGKEGAGVVDDNELRRVRNRIQNLDEDTVLVKGADTELELLDAMDPSKFKEMREMDMRDLALALGVPIELASVISEGLGSGEQSGVRMQAFILEAKAAQRALAEQFQREVLNPVIEQYSPYSVDDLDGIKFGEPLAEEQALSERAPYMTLNEIRQEIEQPPEEDEELAGSYRKPANIQAPSEEEPEDGGGVGGLFGEEAGTGNRNLAGEGVPEFDEPYVRMFEERIWPDDDRASKSLVAFNNSEVPEMVLTRLREVILGGSVFSDIESIPSSDLMELRTTLADSLSDEGWSIRGLTETLEERFGLSENRAETIARTETQAAVNAAREEAYEAREDDREYRFDWVGPSDHRTTEACEWIKSQIPEEGVRMDRLKELIQESVRHDSDIDTEPREFTPHVSCRHTYSRQV
jgi:hypothetical protein